MTQLEAWIVTFLGMTVVFIGLLLCILSINLFNRLAKHVKWGEEGHGHQAPAPPPAVLVAAAAQTPAPPPQTPSELLSSELIAVIAAALEIERRLYLGSAGQRLTLRRTEP